MTLQHANENVDIKVTDHRRSESFKNGVRQNFQFLKQTNDMVELYARSIPLADNYGFLLPLCELHADDGKVIEMLAKWRQENYFAYPTRFPVTLDGTRNWIRSRVLDTDDRILFLVVNRHGQPVGHMGFANAVNDLYELEADNIVRGVSSDSSGIMGKALQAMLDWGEEKLGAEMICLRVLDDNPRAIEFYKKNGFVRDGLIPLRRIVKGQTEGYAPIHSDDTAPADKHFIHMVYAPRRIVGQKMILTAGPSISAREASYALDAARFGWNHRWADYIKRFETSFANYLGVKYALSFSSCTGALHLALLALGVGPGDEVIVPDITWVATANAVLYTGATPIFADVDPKAWVLDPVDFEKCITPRTKAVMPVHLYGHPAPMDEILSVARRHNVFVVEDAAPSIGAEFKGEKTGTFGNLAAFSFQGAKLVVTGEGGILVTDNEELYKKVYSLWDQGRQPGTFWIQDNGWKYKMSNIQAALGLGQLERVAELIESKRRIFRWYEEGLHDVPKVCLCYEPEHTRSIYWMSSVLLDEEAGISRDGLREELKKRNIDTRSVFPAISQYPIWPCAQSPRPVARRVGDQAMNLPSGVCLKREEVAYVCKCIREILGNTR